MSDSPPPTSSPSATSSALESVKSFGSKVGAKVSSGVSAAKKKIEKATSNSHQDDTPVDEENPRPSDGSGNGETEQFIAKPGKLTDVEMEKREKALKEREEKLSKMEKDLEKKSEKVAKLEALLPNWPFKCYAVTYHSIDNEIPTEHQSMVRKFYFYWRFMVFTLIANFIAVIVIWALDGSLSIIDVLLSAFYILAGVPGSWLLWYKPIYKAMKSKSSTSWSMFTVGYTIHILFVICMGLAIPYFAGAGLITFISVLVGGQAAPILFNLAAMICWAICWGLGGYLTAKARKQYKQSGQSVKKGILTEAVKMQIKG